MDSQPKRRVLSLSLSQPSKQHKKIRIKRHPSGSSQNESNNSQTDDSHENSILRNNENLGTLSQLSMSKAMNQSQSKSPLKSGLKDEFTKSQSGTLQNKEASKALDDIPLSKPDSAGSVVAKSDDKEKMSKYGKPSYEVSTVSTSSSVKTQSLSKDVIQETTGLKDHSIEATKLDLEEGLNVCSKQKGSKFSIKTASSLKGPDRYDAHQRLLKSDSPATSESALLIDSGASHVEAELGTSFNEAVLEVLQCPLCYKNFDQSKAKTAHVKGCALKYKLSTQQLIEVLDLQKKQAAERRALGLPDIPSAAGITKKPAASRKEHRSSSKIDNNLQLAMALSLSLQDQQNTLDAYKKTESSSGISLDHFGFTSKPVIDSIHPPPSNLLTRGKKKSSDKNASALLTRTPEERQRIITEKVAMVLLEEVVAEKNEVPEPILKSSYLKECQSKESMLWAKSHISPSKSDRSSYYVDSLRGFISPSKVEMGSKVMHLSQVVGRFTTPTKEPKKQTFAPVALTTSPSEEEISSDSCSPQPKESKPPSHLEMELRAKFFNDWASMVNNASMSDLSIYPKEGREIPAHKIILHVRCSRILKDISRQRNTLTGNEVEVIMWSSTPHAAALAFLEYVYCGSVKSIRVLSEDLSSIIWLANHYRISDLIRYLKALTESSETPETPSQVVLKAVDDSLKTSSFSRNDSEIREISKVLDSVKKNGLYSRECLREDHDTFLSKQPQSHSKVPSPMETLSRKSETESIYSEATVVERENRSLCSSPDMFDDEDFSEQCEIQVTKHSENSRAATGKEECDAVVINNLRSEVDRAPSRCSSVSSDKTVVVEKHFSKLSPCASISSEKTDVIENNSLPPSPAFSQASATTEVMDFDQSVLKGERVSLNDSKRKLLDSPENNDNCKRTCPTSISNEAPPNKNDGDVELCDLTQDSDSNASFPVIQNFSGDSCEKISLSSGRDMSDVESIGRQVNVLNDSDNKTKQLGKSCTPTEHKDIDNKNLNSESVDEVEEAYISPVWDGFEDMNYEDPFPFSQPLGCEASSISENTSPSRQILPSQVARKSSPAIKTTSVSPHKKNAPHENLNLDHRNGMESSSSSDCEVTFHSPVKTKKISNSGYDALLDDSFTVNDSFLQQAETGVSSKLSQREAKGTPLNRILTAEAEGVTPLANYSAMKTPQLKRELQKFGLKPTLGKRKGKIMLRHIYNELHPWVPIEADFTTVSDKPFLSQPLSSKSDEHVFSSSQPNSRKLTYSDSFGKEFNVPGDDVNDAQEDSGSDSDSNASGGTGNTSLQEIRFLEGDCDEAEILSQAITQPGKANLAKVVSDFITHDKELHQKVLEYEPIWIEKLQLDLRTNGFKFKMADIMAFLDEKCITFRTNQSGPRTKKRKPRTDKTKKKADSSRHVENSQLSDSE